MAVFHKIFKTAIFLLQTITKFRVFGGINKMKAEDVVALSTMVATLLTEGRSLQEVALLKNIFNQIHCSIQNIYSQRIAEKKL